MLVLTFNLLASLAYTAVVIYTTWHLSAAHTLLKIKEQETARRIELRQALHDILQDGQAELDDLMKKNATIDKEGKDAE